ncbi:alpha/beta fold hydrolase [Nitratireductor sp. CAU 1489]|uniref:Alpha/beta fold hydrolase n=1 Tax=Nitratireductor arenosus TaxID=2682096 RepID=A0A844QG50_9HYPH|nr:alpha/beta hydrolase [Nitratireductor arenosus]MVA97023.1 alpha/beta fold hydrolase [Nitratireductor arenosus]
MATYVLVHGAWHTGELMEDVARPIRDHGHDVHTPTIAGNRPGDDRRTGLEAAIGSIVAFIEERELTDVILVGHSYGGMIITGTADRLPGRIRRLVYWNAFVPNDGECLNDMVPPHYVALFDAVSAASPDNAVMLPPPIWREAFMNDADGAAAQATYEKLNPHPYATFTDAIRLSANPAEMEVAKSYINFTEDTALPQSLGWHPRLSEKLGLFRLVQASGGHEVCFTNPTLLAEKIIEAGRD